MIWDMLLHWMAHVGQGTWVSFKRAVASLSGPDKDPSEEWRRLRMRFSDLAFAEFFVDESGRWRSFSPLLVSSPHQPQEALLCGARTPLILERIKREAEQVGCRCFHLAVDGFTNVKLYGAKIAEAASAAGIPFEMNIGRRLAAGLIPLKVAVMSAPKRLPPTGCSARSFDYASLRWVDGVRPCSAVEYTSRYEQRSYFVQADASEPLVLPKREAVFAAASLQGVQLAVYDSARMELSTSVATPFPEAHARTACLVAGRASIVRGGRIVYENVPPMLAGVILTSLQHSAPKIHLCSSSGDSKEHS